ncbi:CsbD family protein [Pseudomonas aeruginosa]|nr:CsbD family protein [Pseudomonas aeruginosa]
MNSDVIKGKWKQLTGKIKERWGDLTDDDLQAADGHAEYLVGKLQERYGWSKERAEQEVRDFSDRLVNR